MNQVILALAQNSGVEQSAVLATVIGSERRVAGQGRSQVAAARRRQAGTVRRRQLEEAILAECRQGPAPRVQPRIAHYGLGGKPAEAIGTLVARPKVRVFHRAIQPATKLVIVRRRTCRGVRLQGEADRRL